MRLLLTSVLFAISPALAIAATVFSIGAGTAVSRVDQAASFDGIITTDGTAGLTGVGLDYAEDRIRLSTAGNPNSGYSELFYFDGAFNGQESGGFYYPNGGSIAPTSIRNGFGMVGVEFLFGSGRTSADGTATLSWKTKGGTGAVSSGMVDLMPGTIVGFYNPMGFSVLEVGIFGNNAIAIDRLSVQRSDVALVPVPAGLPLLAAGLMSFGLLRRRRTKRA